MVTYRSRRRPLQPFLVKPTVPSAPTMNTRILLISSAAFLAVLGLVLTFAAAEVLATDDPRTIVVGQLLGAALCGAAFLNWMSRGAPLGGIYGRPLAIGNLVHFTVGGLALVKVVSTMEPAWFFGTLTIGYLVLAALFARVAFFTTASVSR